MSKSGAVVASDMMVMDMAILVPVLVMDLSVDMDPTDMAPTDMADICTVLVHSMVASPFHYTRRVKYFSSHFVFALEWRTLILEMP